MPLPSTEKSAFEYGGVNHCVAAAMRSLIKDFTVLVCQLEQQHRLGQLRLNQLPFYLQESAHLMAATADLVAALNAGECIGGAVLSLLHDRAKAAVGDAKVYELYRHLMRAVRVHCVKSSCSTTLMECCENGSAPSHKCNVLGENIYFFLNSSLH